MRGTKPRITINIIFKSILHTAGQGFVYTQAITRAGIESLGTGGSGNSRGIGTGGIGVIEIRSRIPLSAEDFSQDVTVGIRLPGELPVSTLFIRSIGDPTIGVENMFKAIPLRRLGTPEDVADVVAFFVSDDSRYLTGQVLSIDGGLTMIG